MPEYRDTQKTTPKRVSNPEKVLEDSLPVKPERFALAANGDDDSPNHELPCSRHRRIKISGRACLVYVPNKRRDREDDSEGSDADLAGKREQQQNWPYDIELLLDPERSEVKERFLRGRRQIEIAGLIERHEIDRKGRTPKYVQAQ